MDELQKKYLQLIQRRHPKYAERREHWRFVEQCYEGGREWFKENIFRYYKEGDKEFKDRLTRAYRFNHTREVVDLIDKYIFKMSITRSPDASDAVKRFWKSATLNGLNITDYAKKISKLTSIFGRVWVVVDTTKSSQDEVSTLADEAAGKTRIYSYVLRPEAMCDASIADDGTYNWMLLHEQVRDDEDPLNSSGEMIDRYRLWTREDYTTFTVKHKGGAGEASGLAATKISQIIRSGAPTGDIAVAAVEPTGGDYDEANIEIEVDGPHAHEFGAVPVFPADNVISDEQYTSPGMVDDIAYMDRAVANYLSNLDAIIQDQTFSQLVIPAQSMKGEEASSKLVELGTKRIFSYDAEGGAAPQYISPDVKQAELILSTISKVIAEIYHTAGLSGERTKDDNSQGIDNSSGVAKAYDFERVNSALAAKADSLELVENRLVEFVSRWAGKPHSDERRLVSYPDNFDVRGLYDEFEMAARLSLIEAPAMVRQIQMMQLVDKMFPQLEKSKRGEIESQVKKWAMTPEPGEVEPPGQDAGTGGRANKNRRETFRDAKNSLANQLVKESG